MLLCLMCTQPTKFLFDVAILICMRLGAEMYYVLHFFVGHLFVASHGTKMYSTPLHTILFPLERKKGIASFYCNSVGLFTPTV